MEQKQRVTRPLSYDLDESQTVRIETAKRNDSLFIQIFPRRKVTTEEAISKAEGSPARKIMTILDKILPSKNVAVEGKDTYITIHPPREHIQQFTVEIEKFYEFPIDCEYMKGKIVKELKLLKI